MPLTPVNLHALVGISHKQPKIIIATQIAEA